MNVREVPHKPVVTTTAETTIAEAAQLLDRHAVGSAVVVGPDGSPIGIVTDRDIVTRGVARRAPLDGRIDSIMTPSVICVDIDADLDAVVHLFSTHAVRRLPVLADDRVVAVVTVDDLLVRLSTHFADVVKGVTAQVVFGHPEPGLPEATAPGADAASG